MSKIGRNDPCPCGSGKKYKHCHLNIDKEKSNPGLETIISDYKMKAALKGYPDVPRPSRNNSFISYAKEYETGHIFNMLTGLQLIPQNHGKNLRIEIMAKEALMLLNNFKEPDYLKLKNVIKESYPMYHAEDPPEGLFTETVLFHGGNYTFMPGIASKSADVFRAMTESIFVKKNNFTKQFKDEIYQGIILLLELGERIFSKANIKRYDYIEDIGHAFHFPNTIEDYSIGLKELREICDAKGIDAEVVEYFVTEADNEYLKSTNDDLNPLLYSPLVRIHDRYYFPIISAQAISLNEFIISTAIKHKCEEEFLKLYFSTIWSDVLSACGSMKWLMTTIKLPEIKNNVQVKEAIFQFDAYRLAYVVFKHDNSISDKYHEEEHYIKTNTEKGELNINKRINEVLDYLTIEKKFEGYKFLVLYLSGEIGRFSLMNIEKEKFGEERIWFGAFEFIQLCRSEEWNLLSLLKYARVYREFTDRKSRIMMTDPIDGYSVYKNSDESFYMGDDTNADWINIAPGTGANLFRKAKQKRDLHGALSYVDDRLVYRLVEKSSDFSPLYSTVHEAKISNLLLETYGFPIWIESLQAASENRNYIRQFAEAILFWLQILQPKIKPTLSETFKEPLIIELWLDKFFFSNYTSEELKNTLTDQKFKSHYSNKRLFFYIPGQVLKEISGNTNKGERLILQELIKSFNHLPGVTLSDVFIEETLNELMPVNNKKMILLIDSQNNIQLDTRWLNISHFATDAETGLLLDNQVSILNYPTTIPEKFVEKTEKVAFCNYAVQKLLEFLQDKLAEFDNNDLLRRLIDLNEALTFNREHNKIIIPSQILCFGQSEEYIDDLHKKERKLVSTTLATRCLIEYLAAKPSSGKKRVSLDDIDKLLAIMHEIINWGMISDSIHYGLDNPEIGLLKSGRIGISKSFYDEKMRPFSEANILADIDSNLESFDNRFETWERKPNSKEVDDYWDTVDEAFKQDWGITFTDLNAITHFAVYYAIEKEDSVGFVTKNEFTEQIIKRSSIREDDIKRGIELLLMKERDEYLIAPSGYKNEDVFPWKYNREFSFLRRPFVESRNDDGESIIIWGMRNAQAASRQLYQLFLSGRLKYGGPAINKLLGARNDKRGKNYRKEVFEWFKKIEGIKVWEHEIKIAPNGHLVDINDLGDIDLLVYDGKKNIVYNIECKRTHQAKNIHEMKSELDRYLGRTGQKKHLEKHIQRHEWLLKNKKALASFIKSDTECQVKSFILVSDVIPLTYLAAEELPLPIVAYPELKRLGMSILDSIVNKQSN